MMSLGLKALTARMALGLFVLFAGSQAMAAGSLAIDSLQGEKYGFSFNHPSTDQADARAMRECGSDCAVVLRFGGGQCGAYAADQAKGSNAYGWGTAANSSNAQARAMSECRERGGSSCKVRSWGCDATKTTAEAAPTPQASNNNSNNNSNNGNSSSNNRPAAAGFAMLGEWLVDYVSPTGYTANGSLRVTQSTGNGSYRGVLVLAFVNTEGTAKRVQQDASITVQGNTVTVNGSNPVYLQGTGIYNADNYTLTIGSNNLLRGNNSDAKGVGGAVVISRK